MSTARTREEMDKLSERIIGCAYAVSSGLGAGFLEKVYENALAHELRKSGLRVEQQRALSVEYDGVIVGEYAADLLVEDCILVKLKAVKEFDDIHLAQCLNYLKATRLSLCLMINFGKPRADVRRIVNRFYSNTP